MNQLNLTQGVEQAWAAFMTFVPKLLLAIIIMVVGYFIAKLLSRVLTMVLHKLNFDRLVDRGGIKRALERSKYDPSSLLVRILFYCVLLVALQFAFCVFGSNPVSDILNRLVMYLPNVFAAVLIVIVAQPGNVDRCHAYHPTVPDFSCGFQFHFSSGTRSSTFRVLSIS